MKPFLLENGISQEEIHSIYHEHHNTEGLRHIENGVLRAKIICKTDEKLMNRIELLSKIAIINGWKAKICRLGEPQKCTHCRTIGHTRRSCNRIN